MMRRTVLGVLVVWLAAAATFGQVVKTQPAPGVGMPDVNDGDSTLYVSPRGGGAKAVVAEIAQAKNTVQVLAYSLTSDPIGRALAEAHKRGVKVVVLLDKSQQTAKYSDATFLRNAGIQVLIDDKRVMPHNRVIIIDGKTVITGTFFFTKAAEESNAETIVVIKDWPDLAATYLQGFKDHLDHAVKYVGPTQADAQPAEQAQVPGEVLTVPTPAASAAPQAAPRGNGDVIVHVTKSGKEYHAVGCASLAKSDKPMSLAQAKAKGYTACSKCRPQE